MLMLMGYVAPPTVYLLVKEPAMDSVLVTRDRSKAKTRP